MHHSVSHLFNLRLLGVERVQTQAVPAGASATSSPEHVHRAHAHAELPTDALGQLPVRQSAPFRLPALFLCNKEHLKLLTNESYQDPMQEKGV